MQTVYIVLIVSVAVVALATIILLRNRINKAKIDFSIKDQKASLEVGAGKPKDENKSAAPSKPVARSGFVGNVAEWWSHIRAPEGARVVNNKASMGSSIEIQERSKDSEEQEAKEK